MNEQDKKLYKAAFTLLQENESLIYGALRHCRVRPSWQDYPDLVNESRLTFVDTYCQFVKKFPEKEETDCLNYIYTAILWMIRKVQRKNRMQSCHLIQNESALDEESDYFDLRAAIQAADVFEEVQVDEIFRNLFSRCSSVEKQFIVMRCLEDQSVTVIAERLGYSKRRVHRLRNRVALKALKVVGSK
ncbi:sigma-70 family RNA polymerase sigma factor [Loigolactobacillus iwatensis]|uniref:sigma-70 family RNA polymerase sigma factor n=1 Tax=Loigolactobacillus iwatensis TaxID=1267156 RepID=UPI000F7E93A1|nr:sigma-70 family RNA polymerase sigma factor [Loigolactobacillus iwatensis]